MPDMWVPTGSVFSTLELVALVFIRYEALGQYRTMAGVEASTVSDVLAAIRCIL